MEWHPLSDDQWTPPPRTTRQTPNSQDLATHLIRASRRLGRPNRVFGSRRYLPHRGVVLHSMEIADSEEVLSSEPWTSSTRETVVQSLPSHPSPRHPARRRRLGAGPHLESALLVPGPSPPSSLCGGELALVFEGASCCQGQDHDKPGLAVGHAPCSAPLRRRQHGGNARRWRHRKGHFRNGLGTPGVPAQPQAQGCMGKAPWGRFLEASIAGKFGAGHGGHGGGRAPGVATTPPSPTTTRRVTSTTSRSGTGTTSPAVPNCTSALLSGTATQQGRSRAPNRENHLLT